MIVADVFKVYLYPDPLVALADYNLELAEDITSGILNVDIQFGTDIYEGPQQQIDTGQFTIVTRNPAMDPKINPNLKYNSAIKFVDTRITGFGETNEFFRGYVTDIQVEYQRKDDPIITITGTDIFGAAQRVVINQDTHDSIMALSTGPSWNGITFSEFVPYMGDFTSKYVFTEGITLPDGSTPTGFWFDASKSFNEQPFGNLAFSPAKYIPQVGESYLEVMNKYAQTNLTSFTARGEFGYDYINVYSFAKYDPQFWTPQQDPIVQYQDYDFSSDPADNKPYQSILIDNGYNRVINQVDISNEYRYVDAGQLESTTESFTRILDDSIEEYAISRASISTIYPEDLPMSAANWANRYSENIFQVTGLPGQEIQQITFDNARYEDVQNEFSYSNYNINKLIRIKHQINNDETIDRVYDIAGISHNISPDNWEMNFTLKPSKQEIVFQYQGSAPTLEMNETTGDANFNFTATLVNFDPEAVSGVVWVLSGTEADQVALMWPIAISGNMFNDGLQRTGLTQTWNFDDDGILAPYSFDAINIPPEDNRYGGYGPGIWNVYAYISLTNRFTIVLQQQLVVGTPVVEADFGWTQNLTNNFGQVNFIDTSVNNEIGEVDSYAWDFGDGNTSSERNPIHVYEPAPDETEYEVSLEVYSFGPGGTKVYNTHTETVTLVQPAMVADFTFTQNNQIVTFTNTSTNVGFEEPDAYFWEFDDGTTSTLKNPVHTFPIDDTLTLSFEVKLTIRNIWEQTENVTKTVTVTGLNQSGTYGVRYIKLRIDPYNVPIEFPSTFRAITPTMSFLKAITSDTGQNLTYLKPLLNYSDTTFPLTWRNVAGSNPQQSLGWEYYLTRDPAINPTNAYGLGAVAQSGLNTPFLYRWELVIDMQQPTNFINQIFLTFQTLFQSGGFYNGFHPEDFYPKISVDVATYITDYTPNPAGTKGPETLNGDWLNIGYFKIEPGSVPTLSREMFKMRPFPLNIPYFLYTFNDKIVSFTSVETADSYAWDFGDGTTSTLKDPVKTYASYGTYTVTLEVTNDAVITRTTTEPVIVQAPIT